MKKASRRETLAAVGQTGAKTFDRARAGVFYYNLFLYCPYRAWSMLNFYYSYQILKKIFKKGHNMC